MKILLNKQTTKALKNAYAVKRYLCSHSLQRWKDDLLYTQRAIGEKSQGKAPRDTRLIELMDTTPGFPPLPSQNCLASCRSWFSTGAIAQ